MWGVAYAHATLVSAEPAAGSHLAASPSRVRLVFSEPLEPALARVALVDGRKNVTPLAVASDPHDVHALIAPVDALADGAYRVVWRVVSADGHPVGGSLVFWVGAGQTAAAPGVPAELDAPPTWGPAIVGAPAIPALLRGLGLGSLMSLAGLLFFLSWPGEPQRRRTPRIAIALAVSAALLLALHTLAWTMNASPDHSLTGGGAAAVLSSHVGRAELWRAGLALLALWALWLARRESLALLFAVAALLASGASGHSAAMHPVWAIPAKAIHLLAGAAWLGGLVFLVARARERGADAEGGFARDAQRVSAVALIAATLVVLSGAAQALLFLPSPLDLFRSTYGAITLAKVLGFLVLIAFGAYHRYRVLPRMSVGSAMVTRFTGSLRAEIVVIAIVALLGGLLAYVSPPHHEMADMPSMHSHPE